MPVIIQYGVPLIQMSEATVRGRRRIDKDRLVRSFAESVVAQTNAMWAGDARASNRFANQTVRAYRQLREQGEDGLEALSQLLADESPDVRSAAAAFLLKYKTEEALAVLREVARRPGLIGFKAGEAIKRWESGEWHLDE